MTDLIPAKALDSHIAILGKTALRIEATEADRAYAAGFFDGEGSITIAANHGVREARGTIYNMRIGAAQNDIAPLIWLRKRWGGTIRAMKRKTASHNVTYQWWCFAKQASQFLRDVHPYLIVKKDRAGIALEFQAMLFNPGVVGHSSEYRERQAALRSQLAALNSHQPVEKIDA